MSTTTITVKNKLEIRPGNVISVPGCEPSTSLTSIALSAELLKHCHASIIPVEDVLRLIPGSRIVQVMRPRGAPGTGTGIFIELPEGPPHNGNVCPSECLPDWYAVLRANAHEEPVESVSNPKECAGFSINGCVARTPYDEVEKMLHPKYPNQRPNDTPVGGGL
jgi:hypothetical protein